MRPSSDSTRIQSFAFRFPLGWWCSRSPLASPFALGFVSVAAVLLAAVSRRDGGEELVRSGREGFPQPFLGLSLELPQDPDGRELLRGQQVPEDPRGLRGPVGHPDHARRRHDDVHGDVVLGERPGFPVREVLLHHLAVVDGRHHEALARVEVPLGRQDPPLELGEAFSLPHAGSRAGADGGAPDDHQVHRVRLVQGDGGPVLRHPPAVRALLDRDLRGQLAHRDPGEEARPQTGLRGQQGLPPLERQVPDPALRRVGVDLDDGGGLELGEIGKVPRGRLSPLEVRDPVVDRPGKPCDVVGLHVVPGPPSKLPLPGRSEPPPRSFGIVGAAAVSAERGLGEGLHGVHGLRVPGEPVRFVGASFFELAGGGCRGVARSFQPTDPGADGETVARDPDRTDGDGDARSETPRTRNPKGQRRQQEQKREQRHRRKSRRGGCCGP
mmetsp:Transcript_18813/g.43547  ORF Transcript_18813/g.43547 Transcript_18813/m.43547 type:complete len:440 (+) Transcript_18813:1973-3292(+)